jgi:hypothetical protein
MSITSRPNPTAPIFGRTGNKHSSLRTIGRRLAHRTMAMLERVYPVLLVFAIFAAGLVATIALRLLIWLPISAR